jgi:hypothetical protein
MTAGVCVVRSVSLHLHQASASASTQLTPWNANHLYATEVLTDRDKLMCSERARADSASPRAGAPCGNRRSPLQQPHASATSLHLHRANAFANRSSLYECGKRLYAAEPPTRRDETPRDSNQPCGTVELACPPAHATRTLGTGAARSVSACRRRATEARPVYRSSQWRVKRGCDHGRSERVNPSHGVYRPAIFSPLQPQAAAHLGATGEVHRGPDRRFTHADR